MGSEGFKEIQANQSGTSVKRQTLSKKAAKSEERNGRWARSCCVGRKKSSGGMSWVKARKRKLPGTTQYKRTKKRSAKKNRLLNEKLNESTSAGGLKTALDEKAGKERRMGELGFFFPKGGRKQELTGRAKERKQTRDSREDRFPGTSKRRTKKFKRARTWSNAHGEEERMEGGFSSHRFTMRRTEPSRGQKVLEQVSRAGENKRSR